MEHYSLNPIATDPEGRILPLFVFAGSFPVLLLVSTVVTTLLSWLISKAGPVRHLFGLQRAKDHPAGRLGGFVSALVMALILLLICFLANQK